METDSLRQVVQRLSSRLVFDFIRSHFYRDTSGVCQSIVSFQFLYTLLDLFLLPSLPSSSSLFPIFLLLSFLFTSSSRSCPHSLFTSSKSSSSSSSFPHHFFSRHPSSPPASTLPASLLLLLPLFLPCPLTSSSSSTQDHIKYLCCWNRSRLLKHTHYCQPFC